MEIGFCDFTDEQIARTPRFDRLVQREAARCFAGYDASEHEWSPEPPDDGICRACYEWRRFPPGQRHFGWAWWRVCFQCDHAHHDTEIWIA